MCVGSLSSRFSVQILGASISWKRVFVRWKENERLSELRYVWESFRIETDKPHVRAR
jgi:hypothetical protein